MKEYISFMLGEFGIIWYLAAFTFAFLGQVLLWGIQTYRGIKNNPESPSKFSRSYWVSHNLAKKVIYVIIVFVAVFCGLRFAPEVFNTPATLFLAFIFGLGAEFLIDKMWSLRNLLTKKDDTLI